jgi:predicted small secreted protein
MRPLHAAQRIVSWGDDKLEKRFAMKGKFLLAMVIGAALGLSACATVKGVGRDIESVGQAGSDAINK